MKPKMMSARQLSYLFYHILDGFESSHRGIAQLKKDNLASDEEITALIEKNSERLIERIKEFRLIEKITCIAFACLFTWFQISGEDIEMRRARRTRGRRKNETEQTI